ncbi:MAG: TonB-dependent siderophore receptor [Nostoc sp. S4]|nr:TonB-dependent siderophore receptor [Nostoc sp. S4]
MRFHLVFTVSSLLITVFSITVADAKQLLSEKSNASGEVNSKIHSASKVQVYKTSAKYLLRTPRNQNKVPQLSQATSNVVSVTDVKVNTTDKGIELILVTPNSLKLQVLPKTEGNSYIADIKNAQLQLASGDFRQDKPYPGIALITATNVDANTLRVTVVGETSTPVVELFDNQIEGLVFGVTPAVSTAQQPTTPPQQNPTQQKQPPIELEVTAPPDTYRVPNTSIGTKTDTPLRDIPQSIQVIPRQVIEDQQPRYLVDVLRNAGVSKGNLTSQSADTFVIRGFDARSNLYRNGVRDRLSNENISTSTTNIERIEVLRGPSSVLYGQGSPGGTVNIVTKQPLSQPYYAFEVRRGGYELFQPSLDLSGPLTKDGNLLYRLNTSYRTTEDFTDFFKEERYFVAPVIGWRIGKNTNLTFDAEYQDLQQTGMSAIPQHPASGSVLPNPNGKIPISRYLGEPDDFYNSQQGRFAYNFEHRFSQNWSIKNSFQYAFLTYDLKSTFINSPIQSDNRTVLRRQSTYRDPLHLNSYALDTNIVGKFNTGSINHQILFGFDLLRQIKRRPGLNQRNATPIDIFNPVYRQPLVGSVIPIFDDKTKDNSLGFYIQDQVKFNNLTLVVGGRYDWVENEVNSFITPETTSQSDSAFSPRVGIIYQPIAPVSLYASYSRSFEQVTGTTISGSLFKPRRGTQYEVGVKTDLLDNKLSATLALYELTLTNALTPDLNNVGFSVQTGEQRSRGVELSVAGEILPGWNVIGFYGYTDARITKDNRIPIGNKLFAVPENFFSLQTTYIIPKGAFKGFGGGISFNYVGEQEADNLNTYKLPSYFLTDAALYYRNNNLSVGLIFKNLFNVQYYNPNVVTRVDPGRPYTAELTVKWEF